MDKHRYARQLSLDSIGLEGQQKLLDASIAIVGCGGLGAIAAMYLAGAGVGNLTLIDGDKPDLSNLHRQVFFNPDDTGSKAHELKERISLFNPDIEVTAIEKMISKQNCHQILEGVDLVLECTDSVQAKYLVNDYCHMEKIPCVYAAIHKEEGYVSFFQNEKASNIHLRDVFPIPDDNIPTCAEVGVMNTLAGIMGLIQATEAIKYIVSNQSELSGKLLIYDVRTYNQVKMKLKKSWEEMIEETWNKNAYTDPRSCSIPEITYEQLSKHADDYQIISILEKKDHVDILPGVEHLPLSRMDRYNWEPADDRPVVFYCNVGKKSMHLVMQLKEEDPEWKLYSLRGGKNAVT